MHFAALANSHRRRPLPTERQEIWFVDLCRHAVARRRCEGEALCNPITMSARIGAQRAHPRVVNLPIWFAGCDSYCASDAITYFTFETGSSAAAVVVNELHRTPPSPLRNSACRRSRSGMTRDWLHESQQRLSYLGSSGWGLLPQCS